MGAGLLTAVAMLPGSAAFASGEKGCTYGLYAHDSNLGIYHVGFDGTGNPYVGDILCRLKRLVLCVNVDGSARPNYVATPNQEFYQGWIEGHYTTTPPWVSNYNPEGAFTAFGFGNIRADVRYWVAVSDHPGSCWNP